jgi:hypothetical protein
MEMTRKKKRKREKDSERAQVMLPRPTSPGYPPHRPRSEFVQGKFEGFGSKGADRLPRTTMRGRTLEAYLLSRSSLSCRIFRTRQGVNFAWTRK